MPGAPCLISVKVRQPVSRFLTMIGVHRSASSSEVRATGQNWPYVRIDQGSHVARTVQASFFDIADPAGFLDCFVKRILTCTDPANQGWGEKDASIRERA